MARPQGQAHSINKALTDSQVKRLLDVASASTRDTALIWMCLSGCRIGETTCVKYADVLGVDGEVLSSFVLNRGTTKGKRTREVLLSNKARNALKAHIAARGPQSGDTFVFPLNPSYAATLVKTLMAKSGLDYRYSSHSLRKTFASKAVANKVNIKYIQKCMGHTNLQTTDLYISLHCTESEKEVLNLW